MSFKNLLTGDWFSEGDSDTEWLRSETQNSMGLEESARVQPVQGVIEELSEKNKILELGWKELQKSYDVLKEENKALTLKLANEKQTSMKYYSKLKYIQDHYEIFNRLKQAFLSMKYNESVGRPMVEISEKSCQTFRLTYYASEDDEYSDADSTKALVKEDEIAQLKETLKKLKMIIRQREESFSFNRDREEEFRKVLKNLEFENKVLQDLISLKIVELEQVRCSEESKLEVSNREVLLLKKIIFKLERRLRELEKLNKNPKGTIYPLNVKERELVNVIFAKYIKHIEKKSECLSHPLMTSLSKLQLRTNLILNQQDSNAKRNCSGASSVCGGTSDSDNFPPSSSNSIA